MIPPGVPAKNLRSFAWISIAKHHGWTTYEGTYSRVFKLSISAFREEADTILAKLHEKRHKKRFRFCLIPDACLYTMRSTSHDVRSLSHRLIPFIILPIERLAMRPKILTLSRLHAEIYLPKKAEPRSVFYALTAVPPAFSQLPELNTFHTALVILTGMDWERDLPPWNAPPLYPDEPPFLGGADFFLSQLLTNTIPTIEARYQLPQKDRVLIGVSLAGLFAAYTACRSDAFPRIASISGSLWYDGFVQFLTRQPPRPSLRAAYFSLGRKEKNSRLMRLASIENATIQTVQRFKSCGIETTFELNPGTHFTDIPLRIRKAITWLGENG